jgi:hypothetical protein
MRMLEEITKAISALGALCVILQNNPEGARVLLALVIVAFAASQRTRVLWPAGYR